MRGLMPKQRNPRISSGSLGGGMERPDSMGTGFVCMCECQVSGKASFSKFTRFSRMVKNQKTFS